MGFVPQEFPHNASSATYSIDGGPPIVFLLKGFPPGPTSTVYNQIFFTTPELLAGPHLLVVVYQGTGQQTPLTLDSLYVTNTSEMSRSPMLISTITNSFPTTLTRISTPIMSPISIFTTSNSFGPTATNPATQLGRDNSPVGVIVGGVVGGVSLIFLTLFLLWRYKQRSQHGRPYINGICTSSHEVVSPFISLPGPRLSSTSNRDILVNPSFRDGLGPQMQRGPVTKPALSSLIPPSFASAVNQSTKSAAGLWIQRGTVSNPFYPSSPHPMTTASHTQPTSLQTPRNIPPTGPSLSPRLDSQLGSIPQMALRRELRDQERMHVLHQDSGLRFGGRSVPSSILPVYTVTET